MVPELSQRCRGMVTRELRDGLRDVAATAAATADACAAWGAAMPPLVLLLLLFIVAADANSCCIVRTPRCRSGLCTCMSVSGVER